jgi:hypothetical protein
VSFPDALSTIKLSKWVAPNRNTIFYLHLAKPRAKQERTSQYPSSSTFESLILYYLDRLEDLLYVLVSVEILPFSESLVDSASPTDKSATLVCGLERFIRATRELLPTRTSYPRQLLGMIRCLCTLSVTGNANLGTEIWARVYYSELNTGFSTNSIPERLIRHTLERVLLYLADAERICFTDLTQSTGVGNLCFCIRQLRQAISHHLLFQTSSASIEKGSLVPKFVERETGFSNFVLLHDAAIDILDQDNSQPSAPKTWTIFLGAMFVILGFISSHHTCLIFSLLAAPPDMTHALIRQSSGWSSIRLAASAGVIGCFCDRARPGTVMFGTIPCALGVFLVLVSPQTASSPLVISIDAISTNHLMFLSVVPLLLVSAHEEGFWTTMENTAMLYVIICLIAFAIDRSGMKRQRRDLARICRKYKRRNEDLAGVHGSQSRTSNVLALAWNKSPSFGVV